MDDLAGRGIGSASLRRASRGFLLAVASQAALVLVHFIYGARLYDDPGRLHAVHPTVGSFLLTCGLTAALFWRPTKLLLVPLIAVAGIPFILVFGLYHGAYSHVLKSILFFANVPERTLVFLFQSADFVIPNDALFEISGAATFPLGVVVGVCLLRLAREVTSRSASPASSSPRADGDARVLRAPQRSASAGPARLVGMAVRMLLDAPVKSLGTLIGVVVSVFLMSQQTSLLVGILGRVTSFVNGSGVDLWIVSQATESTEATDSVAASRVGAAASTPGVKWAAPVVQGIGKVTRPDGVREFVKVLGVEAPRYAGLPRSLAPGTSMSSLRASGRLLLNWNDRPTFADAVPGDRIEIDGKAGIVGGFFQGMDPHSPYYYVYANIDDARAFTQFPQDRVTYVAVGADPARSLEDVKARLQARIPSALVQTREEMSDLEKRYFLVRTPVGVVFGMGSLVAAVIGAAIVAVTMYSTAVDRSRDYGTLKAIGARQRDILALLLIQALLFAVVGYVLGLCAFLVIRHWLPQLPMVVQPRLLLGVGVASILSCVLASLAAVRRVLSLDPGIVFR